MKLFGIPEFPTGVSPAYLEDIWKEAVTDELGTRWLPRLPVLTALHKLRDYVASKLDDPREMQRLLQTELHFDPQTFSEVSLALAGEYPAPGKLLGQTWGEWDHWRPSYVVRAPAVNVYPSGYDMNSWNRVAFTALHEFGHVLAGRPLEQEDEDHGPRWQAACRRIGANCYKWDPVEKGDDQMAYRDDVWATVQTIQKETGL